MPKICKFVPFIIMLLVIALFVFTIAYSVNNSIDEGQLVDKFHEIVHSRSIIGNFEFGEMDQWRFVVENGDKRDEWYVSEDCYNSYNIGDWVKKR